MYNTQPCYVVSNTLVGVESGGIVQLPEESIISRQINRVHISYGNEGSNTTNLTLAMIHAQSQVLSLDDADCVTIALDLNRQVIAK